MADTGSALWREMLTYLKTKHPSICRQWFDDLTPLGMEPGLLNVHAANDVHRRYLQTKGLEPFKEAVQAVTGRLMSVRFTGEWTTPKPLDAAMDEAVIPAVSVARASNGSSGRAASRDSEALDPGVVLLPDYEFATFVEGPNNQLAYAAAQGVAEAPGDAYNPLFIHGDVGLGKTHLLQAVCRRILEARPGFRILYVSCEKFANEFIELVASGNMAEFRHRYRDVDMLVIDDIHFLTEKERMQEEFFHTFNELHQTGRQIVLSSDAAPAEIPELEERLVSRFQSGLVAQVTKPGFETRLAILKSKGRLRGLELPDDVLDHLARRIDSHARELEGALNRLQAEAQLPDATGKPYGRIDLPLAQRVFPAPAAASPLAMVTMHQIVDAVTRCYQVKLQDLQSRRRHKSITEPRQVCMWLARRHTRFSLAEVGGHFGGRDHTTVIHSVETVDNRMSTEPAFAKQVLALEASLIADGGGGEDERVAAE